MNSLILKTNGSTTPLVLRLVLAIVLFPHGAQKLLGWYGGFGFEGTMSFFTETLGLPWLLSFLVILLEFFGPILLLIGFATRFISLALIFLMLGIVFTSHSQYGFFMNWFGTQKGEGVEYFLLFIGGALSLLLSGGGIWSLDKNVYERRFSNAG